MRILLAEDDELLGVGLRAGLQQQGFEVDWVRDGQAALRELLALDYEAAVLDLGLPRLDGMEVLAALREQGRSLPVLVLTARDAVQSRIAGLDTGADDYVVKPYSVVELMARLRTQLRRTRPASMGERLSFEDIILDSGEHRVFRDGQPLKLGPTEFRLLSTLMEKPGRVWTRDQLLDRVWGRDIYVDTRTIDVHVGRLRKALMTNGGADPVRTVRGTGYSLG